MFSLRRTAARLKLERRRWQRRCRRFFSWWSHPYSRRVGLRGESLASRRLRRSGFAILERNWRSRAGELDIIARRGGLVVFLEVKTRQARFSGRYSPLSAVDHLKRRQVRRTARAYLRGSWRILRRYRIHSIRFDVIAVRYRRRAWPLPPVFMIEPHPGKAERLSIEFGAPPA